MPQPCVTSSPAPVSPVSPLTSPATGREYKRLRILGLRAPLKDVARRLGCHPMTLQRWEQSAAAVPDHRAGAWRAALLASAQGQAEHLAEQGIAPDEFAGTDFARALAALGTSSSSGSPGNEPPAA